MSNTNTGGPAFPTSFNKDYPTEIVGGMNLRDYFAAKAMQVFLTQAKSNKECNDIPMAAYNVADAMLKERGSDSTMLALPVKGEVT